MVKRAALLGLALELLAAGCGGGSGSPSNGTAGTSGAAGATGTAGASGAAGVTGTAGMSGAAGATGTAGMSGAAGVSGNAGASGGAGAMGNAGAGGTSAAGSGGTRVDAGNVDAIPVDDGPFLDGPNMLPAGYAGKPYTLNKIPGRINAADYDRGGAGVAWCHAPGGCAGGTVTGDYPSGAPVYRQPMPANAKVCGGAACDDNVGVCRMNPSKPDKIDKTNLAPAEDTYLCYTQAGTWTKYTVVVGQAGTYAVGGFQAVPQGGAMNLSFGGTITTGNVTLPVSSPVDVCGGGEYYHCWIPRQNLATVTFPSAGTYLMTLTQVGRFNADNLTFTKM